MNDGVYFDLIFPLIFESKKVTWERYCSNKLYLHSNDSRYSVLSKHKASATLKPLGFRMSVPFLHASCNAWDIRLIKYPCIHIRWNSQRHSCLQFISSETSETSEIIHYAWMYSTFQFHLNTRCLKCTNSTEITLDLLPRWTHKWPFRLMMKTECFHFMIKLELHLVTYEWCN